MSEKIKNYRVREVTIDKEPHYYIEVSYLYGLIWAELDITKPTNDKSIIENRLKELSESHPCLVDRGTL